MGISPTKKLHERVFFPVYCVVSCTLQRSDEQPLKRSEFLASEVGQSQATHGTIQRWFNLLLYRSALCPVWLATGLFTASMPKSQNNAIVPQAKKVAALAVDENTKSAAKARPRPIKEKEKPARREQQRTIETRRAILDAALNEFAERGFEGASVRRIGERAGLEYTLITYHFENKDTLWREVAIDAFAQMDAIWAEALGPEADISAADYVRLELRTLLRFTVEHTAFHHFMLQENHGSSPRLKWLVKNILTKARERIVPKIRQAQEDGQMQPGDPDLLYYMLLGMTTVLSSLKDEINATIKVSLKNAATVDAYWQMIERSVFK